MTINELQGYKKILLLGYGKEGQATEHFLHRFVPEAEILIADQANDPQYLERQTDADLVIKTPGIPKRLVTRPYTTATNIFFANIHHPVIGVTGSKGKSTTTALIAAILRESGKTVHLVGNIGEPAINLLSESVGVDDAIVMELSSYQLDDIEYAPQISVFVSFFPDHLDYHGSLEAYFEAKSHITTLQGKQDLFVYHPGYPRLEVLARETSAKAISFLETCPFSFEGMPLLGEHNRQNMLGAMTVCKELGVSFEIMERALRSFKPLPHRLTNIGTYQGITFYDDAIASTPEAAVSAIKTLPQIGTLFLGGTDRGYDFTVLAETICEYKIPNLVFFPDTGVKIEALLEAKGYKANSLHTESMEEAVQFAYNVTEPGSICLLSTGSPSYRLWKGFEEKGDLFTRYVKTPR
ncbi:UDP-N-acetylmuramoyl-L-alanine--D-glutamate ligase [Patescibacteria group bacterium]|nr:UDP-N-acetylmuramoyl-L-alanine--D-glutamate ligase [Patescibacteria group bacterium]